MTPENFTYWLQGFAEICGQTPSKEQREIIKDHLDLVFLKAALNKTVNEVPPEVMDNYLKPSGAPIEKGKTRYC